MPRFLFECSCGVQFSKTLKMGIHETHTCPECYEEAPRVFEEFGFNFAASPKLAEGNTGVAKHDYPTADQAVGSSSEKRWAEIKARDQVKNAVREKGATHALIRRQGVENNKPFVEYEAGSESLLNGRKKLVKTINTLAKNEGGQ